MSPVTPLTYLHIYIPFWEGNSRIKVENFLVIKKSIRLLVIVAITWFHQHSIDNEMRLRVDTFQYSIAWSQVTTMLLVNASTVFTHFWSNFIYNRDFYVMYLDILVIFLLIIHYMTVPGKDLNLSFPYLMGFVFCLYLLFIAPAMESHGFNLY